MTKDDGFVDPMTMLAYRAAIEAEGRRIADVIDNEVLAGSERWIVTTPTQDSEMAEYRRCGESNGLFYDRRGDYFREGVDPRNHIGRFVTDEITRGQLSNAAGCQYYWRDNCNCGAPLNG